MDPETPPSAANPSEFKPMLTSSTHFDIVIAGGGTVGSLLALALTRLTCARTLKIAIIEAQSLDLLNASPSPNTTNRTANNTANETHPGFDNRAIALSRHSLDFLYSLGLEEQITQVTEAICDIHVSDQYQLGQSVISAESLVVEESGRVIELQDFGRILHSALQKHAADRHSEQNNLSHCQWFCPDSIEQVTVQLDAVQLTLHSQQHISASLLLVTEGGNSATRAQLPVQTQIHDYQQSAVIVNVQMSQAHQNRAFERFTENGPLAFLPMTQDRCSVVWTIAREQENTVMNWCDEQFASALQSAFGYRLGKVLKVGKRHCYPLRLVLSNSQHLHRAALLGNAAQMLHPIAGQGFNLGLRDVEDMVNAIATCLESSGVYGGMDPGNFALLTAYRRKRQADVQQTVLATHGLVHLFSNRAMLPVAGRNLGLFCLDNSPVLKRWFGRRAMGMQQTGSKQSSTKNHNNA